MEHSYSRFHVLTGGPGSGKTSLIEELNRRGFATIGEAGRAIIRDQVDIGGSALPWADRRLFAEVMLAFDLRHYIEAGEPREPVFFDRGLPDIVGYLDLCGLPVPPHIEKAARVYRYARRVFILPFWPEIFATDSERKQSADEARVTCKTMAVTYERLGYDLVEVPPATIGERAEFILATIGR